MFVKYACFLNERFERMNGLDGRLDGIENASQNHENMININRNINQNVNVKVRRFFSSSLLCFSYDTVHFSFTYNLRNVMFCMVVKRPCLIPRERMYPAVS